MTGTLGKCTWHSASISATSAGRTWVSFEDLRIPVLDHHRGVRHGSPARSSTARSWPLLRLLTRSSTPLALDDRDQFAVQFHAMVADAQGPLDDARLLMAEFLDTIPLAAIDDDLPDRPWADARAVGRSHRGLAVLVVRRRLPNTISRPRAHARDHEL